MARDNNTTQDGEEAGPSIADVSRDVERILDKWKHGQNTSTVSHKPPVAPKLEVEDCLNTTEATNQSHPLFQRKTPSPTKAGYTFGSPESKRGQRFVSPDQSRHDHQGAVSPGPKYTLTSFTDRPLKAQSFPRALKGREKHDLTPGPQYEIPGSLGKQLTRSSSPAFRLGQALRFNDVEYISPAHSKTTTSKTSPGPNAYTPVIDASHGSAYSFASGGRDVPPGKLFLSKEHALHDGVGSASPGPRYAWEASLVMAKAPSYSFGLSDRPGDNPSQARRRKKRGDTEDSSQSLGDSDDASTTPTRRNPRYISAEHAKADYGVDSPGPGAYTPNEKAASRLAPAYKFSTSAIGVDLSNGVVSPGPQYLPKDTLVRQGVPGTVFGDRDPLLARESVRFPEKRYLGPVVAATDNTGKFSPGPVYDGEKQKSAPAYSLGRREKVLLKRICPSPERARFISKELAKENLGAYSPGPKYSIPTTIGSETSKKYSFGKSDRQFEDPQEIREKLGTVAKPYTTPAEARYFSNSLNKNHMLGKFSPGPKYSPDLSAVMPNAPKHTMAGKWKASEPEPPTKEEYEEEKQKSAKGSRQDLTQKAAPAFKFATSKRGLLRGEENKRLAMPGRDSPGPCYHPNFEAVDPKSHGGLSFGGLR